MKKVFVQPDTQEKVDGLSFSLAKSLIIEELNGQDFNVYCESMSKKNQNLGIILFMRKESCHSGLF